ncbi:MAG: hypothetical protein LAQ30_24955 [Acidobacteriia bacterium]|nr:hypothetical protein [Terriglobia bacterium]
MESLDAERKEVLESVLEALAIPDRDGDKAAACMQLLRGLMGPRPGAASVYLQEAVMEWRIIIPLGG